MKMIKFLFALSVIALVLLFTFVPTVSAQNNDPLAVAQAFEAAINAHDLDAALTLFADDATWTDTHPAPDVPNPLQGKDAIKGFLTLILQAKPHDEASNLQVNGDTVTWFSKETLENPGAIDPNAFPP